VCSSDLGLEVVLEARAILALIGAQVLDIALKLVAFPFDGAECLLTALVCFLVKLLSANTRIGLNPIGLASRLVDDTVRLGLRFAHNPVGLFFGLLHQFFGII